MFAGTWLQKRTASQILLLPFYLARNSLIHRYLLCMYCVRVVPLVFGGSTSSPIPRRLLHMVGSLGIGMWHYYGHVLSQPLLISFLPVSPSLTHPHSFLLLPSLSLSHLPFGLLPSKIPTGNSKNKISSLEKDI